MPRSNIARSNILYLIIFILFLTGFSTLDYTKKDEPLLNMPKGNPDLSLGIVVHSHSTGRDVIGDSSQNIRFSAIKNYKETAIQLLRSRSLVDKMPKKFQFIDEMHGFSSDKIYEFSMMFDSDNHEWDSISFMPFCSVIEWVTEPKLREYLDGWVKKFENAGWKRIEYPKSDDPRKIQNFSLPTSADEWSQYCAWKTRDYKAAIKVMLRDNHNYSSYLSKKEGKNIKEIPNGYIAFIKIYKNNT